VLVFPTATKSICNELEKETWALFVLAIVLSNIITWPVDQYQSRFAPVGSMMVFPFSSIGVVFRPWLVALKNVPA